MSNKTFTKDYQKFPVQYYPLNIKDYYFKKSEKIPLLNKKTKIVSMGSCFALHIAKYLKKHNYNYLVGEKYFKYLTSADWDMVFNTACIKQIFQYSFEEFAPIVRWWDRGKVMDDPFRRQISYPKGKHEQELKKHVEASHAVLSQADIVVITLGLVEVWRDKRDLATYWRTPPIHLIDKNIHEFHVMDANECLADLDHVHKLLSKYNPKCKIIITVSPVAMRATFRTDVDPIAANVYSKCTLRSAAGMFADKYDNVFYFPSFEFVIFGFANPFQERDNMHVKQSVIDTMMKFFERRYVK
jgi:hypothetical protein